MAVKVYDEDGRLIREGEPRKSSEGFTIRYELLSIIGIMIVQTCAGVWWAAVQTSEIGFFRQQLAEIKIQLSSSVSDRYRSSDAQRDFSSIEKRIERNELRMSNLESIIRGKS